MDPSLLEQFLGPSSTQFQLPVLTEDENDELHPLLSIGFQRFSQTRKSLPGKCYVARQQGLTRSWRKCDQHRSCSSEQRKKGTLEKQFRRTLWLPRVRLVPPAMFTRKAREILLYVDATLIDNRWPISALSRYPITKVIDIPFDVHLSFFDIQRSSLVVRPFSLRSSFFFSSIKSSSNRFIELINYSFFPPLSLSLPPSLSLCISRARTFENF